METDTCSVPIAQKLTASVYHVCDKANTEQIYLHLQKTIAKLPKAVHALVVLDNTSWHTFKKLKVPDNVWLLHLLL